MSPKRWTRDQISNFETAFAASDFDIRTWQSVGVDYASACLMNFWGKGPDEAVELNKRGVTSPPDMRFANFLGLSFAQACKWVEAGFDFDSASAWIGSGFSFAQACKWVEAGFDFDSASAWIGSGFSFAQACKWLWAGLDLDAALSWLQILPRKATPDLARKWSKAGLDEVDASNWINLSVTEPAIANSWLQSGFTAEAAEEWIKWGVMPVDAEKFVDAGLSAPDDGYRQAGISLSAAMSWTAKGFESEEYFGMEQFDYWKFWHDAGLTPDLAELLCAKIEESISLCIESKIYPRGFGVDSFSMFQRFDPKSAEKRLKGQLVDSVTELSKAGLGLTIENLIKWRGISAKVILASIDNQIDPDTAYEMGEVALAPYSKPISDLLRKTKSVSMPQEFTHRGLKEDDLKKLLELNYELDDIVRVMSDSKIDGPVLLKWAINGWRVTERVFLSWYAEGFGPQLASTWRSHGFDAVLARAWIKTGVKDPEVARRRSSAGILPTK